MPQLDDSRPRASSRPPRSGRASSVIGQSVSSGRPLSSRPAPPEVLECSQVMTFVRAGGAVVLLWTSEPTVEAVQRIGQFVGEFAVPTRAVLVLIGSDARPPSATVRATLASLMTAHGVGASAVVIDEEGFRGAAVRAVATGIALLARAPYRHRVFSSAVEAARWLEREVEGAGGSVRADAIRRAVDVAHSRARLD